MSALPCWWSEGGCKHGFRRGAKEKLEHILKGQEPYDIFVRWKSLEKQSIGWRDGVRFNIPPWYHVFNSNHMNDHHLRLAKKRVVREAA